MIGRFKYSGQRAYGRPLAMSLAKTIAERTAPMPEALIPVPMHPRKQRRRGFNQAEEVTHWLSRQLHIPMARHLLQRTRQAEAQSTLHRRQRLRNLKGAFTASGRVPAHVALVDDVMTTGATAQELARLLKKNGAQQVEIWVLARTPLDRIR
jgi:ComF family protein